MAPMVSEVPAMTAWASMVGKAPSSTRSTSVQREAMCVPSFHQIHRHNITQTNGCLFREGDRYEKSPRQTMLTAVQ